MLGLSILLMATIIGTLASFAIFILCKVCSLTPSLAATTNTTISVMDTPLFRIEMKAACPGVSKNVIRFPDFRVTIIQLSVTKSYFTKSE